MAGLALNADKDVQLSFSSTEYLGLTAIHIRPCKVGCFTPEFTLGTLLFGEEGRYWTSKLLGPEHVEEVMEHSGGPRSHAQVS